MREVRHLTSRDVHKQPWKNGRGFTEELAIWPKGASFERGTFDWRISRAKVDAPGPFSKFAGFDRILVVTDGGGLVLTHGKLAPRARLRTLEPYRFSGDWPTACELIDGKVGDLSVLVRRGVVDADVQVLNLGRRRAREVLAPAHAFAHVLSGKVGARISGEEDPFALGPRESLWVQSLEQEAELDVTGKGDDAVVLLIRIAPSSAD